MSLDGFKKSLGGGKKERKPPEPIKESKPKTKTVYVDRVVEVEVEVKQPVPKHIADTWKDLEPSITSVFAKWKAKTTLFNIFRRWMDEQLSS